MLVLYKIFFTVVSLLLLAVIYLINMGIEIGPLTGIHMWFDMPAIVSYLIYILGSLFLTWLCTLAFPNFETIDLHSSNIKAIESADSTFVPMYLAYVFVGVSIQNDTSLIWCYLLIVIICFFAQNYYFNPLYYLLGYRYYFVINSTDKKILIMTKKQIYLGQEIDFTNLKRLNDYSYVDINR